MNNTSIYAQPMVRITTYLTQNQDSIISSIAATTGKTKADVIREAIDLYRDKTDNEVEDFIKGFQNGFKPRNKTSFNTFLSILKPGTPSYLNTVASTLNDFSRVVMCMPRQMGGTTTLCALALFKVNTPKTNIIYGVAKGGVASRVMDIFCNLLATISNTDHIPTVTSRSKSRIEFSNGSIISIENMSSDNFFSTMQLNKSNTTYILDEFAFITDYGRIAADTVIDAMHTPGSRIYVSSTPNGAHLIDKQSHKPYLQCFYALWLFAKQYASPARAIFVNWDCAPSRDENFKNTLIASFGEESFEKEFECKFIDTDENTFVQTISSEDK